MVFDTLVDVDWLMNHLNDKTIFVFDASIPKVTINQEYNNKSKIVGAQFFDIKNKFSNTASQFPNTIPTEKQFEEELQKLGVNSSSYIVVYDDKGIYSSARAWWLLKTFGHNNVVVLNGGLPEWERKGYPTESIKVENKKPLGNFEANFQKEEVIYFYDVEFLINDEKTIIIDARSSDRYNCLVPEPRQGLRSGSIPNAINIPYSSLLNDGKLKPKNELKMLLSDVLQSNVEIVSYCGSGVTACLIALALNHIGNKKTKIYDGSWTEYGTLVEV